MIKTQLWGLSYFKTSYNLHMGKQIENGANMGTLLTFKLILDILLKNG